MCSLVWLSVDKAEIRSPKLRFEFDDSFVNLV